MPRIRRYFRYFLPTVRSLALKEPRGSIRQIIYFIGLFQHLQDLKLLEDMFSYWQPEEQAEDSTLLPPFVPPLRGWLTLTHFKKAHFWKEMIILFGGIRFRYMRLFHVDRMRFLLGACAETLEVLVLDADDPNAWYSLREFDFSRKKSFRKLQVPATSIDWASSNGSPGAFAFLKHVFSTITPTTSLKIIVLYGDCNFPSVEYWHSQPPFRELLRAERAEEVSRQRWRFKVLREVRKVRDFQLELCASVSGAVGEGAVRILEEAIAEEEAKEAFCGLFSDPPVTYNPQRSRR